MLLQFIQVTATLLANVTPIYIWRTFSVYLGQPVLEEVPGVQTVISLGCQVFVSIVQPHWSIGQP